MCTAVAAQEWYRDDNGNDLHWPVDGYQEAGKRNTHWFVANVVKHHRTVETYVNGLRDAGLLLARVEEPKPTREVMAARPDLISTVVARLFLPSLSINRQRDDPPRENRGLISKPS